MAGLWWVRPCRITFGRARFKGAALRREIMVDFFTESDEREK